MSDTRVIAWGERRCKVCHHAGSTHPTIFKLSGKPRLCMISGCYCMEFAPDSRRYKHQTTGQGPHGLKFDATKWDQDATRCVEHERTLS